MKKNGSRLNFFDNVYVLAKKYTKQALAGKEGTVLGIGQNVHGKIEYSVRLIGESFTRTFLSHEITAKKIFLNLPSRRRKRRKNPKS